MSTTLNKLKKKKICFLGLGLENIALLEYLLKEKVEADFSICDSRNNEALGSRYDKFFKFNNIGWRLGTDYDKDLDHYDIIFRSAGYPLFTPEIKKAINAGLEVSSPIKLFFELLPTKHIIGVTGSKGKGTTSALILSILKKAGKRVHFGGNIGYPIFSFYNKIKPRDWVILEISSFILEDLYESPHIAVVTNLTKEHLAPADPLNPNYHKSLKIYQGIKQNIIKYQYRSDYSVLNKKLKRADWQVGLGKKIYFSKSSLPSLLPGEHNQENIAAAVEVAKIIGINKRAIAGAVKEFKGLEYRLEKIGEKEGILYFNDSFATTPEATITALKSFNAPIVLLAGGAEKNNNFQDLAREIKRRVKYLVLFDGVATPRLKKELTRIGFSGGKMEIVKSMQAGVKLARAQAESGDIVLMSPACASFGMFRSYKERGRLFKEAVEEIK